MPCKDNMREKHIEEIRRLEDAMQKSQSEKLKTDYGKAVKRMKRELKIYDALKRGEYGKRTKPEAGSI